MLFAHECGLCTPLPPTGPTGADCIRGFGERFLSLAPAQKTSFRFAKRTSDYDRSEHDYTFDTPTGKGFELLRASHPATRQGRHNCEIRSRELPGGRSAAVAAAFSHLRTRLLSIPTKCAAETVAVSEPREAEAIIRAAVYEALTDENTPKQAISCRAMRLVRMVGGMLRKRLNLTLVVDQYGFVRFGTTIPEVSAASIRSARIGPMKRA